MKILILSIFNDTSIYNKMLELQNKYINNTICQNIHYYFVTFRNEQDELIVKDGNIIYVKGEECYLGITYKTLKALKYLLNISKYDYIIRTNISTIIQFSNLINFLNTLPKTNVYLGGILLTLNWIDYKAGINETTNQMLSLCGLKYIQGTSIILSNNIAEYILQNFCLINNDIVDDVAIGLFIRDNLPDIYSNLTSDKCCKVSFNEFSDDSIFIRNNTFVKENFERQIDLERMTNIIDYLCINHKNHKSIDLIEKIHFPKIIYLVHKNYELLKKSSEQWKDLNPEYTIELYDDKRCRQILIEKFGQLYCDIFDFIKDGPIKCDFFRVCILYLCGGIYVDADVKPLVPISQFIDDDLDFATCISYNYNHQYNNFLYNPQFILSKKYDENLYNIIHKYINYYINKIEYSYWSWSICKLMEKITDFELSINSDNIFTYNNKKYKFFTENIYNNKDKFVYYFSNFDCQEYFSKYSNVVSYAYVTYKNYIIFENFGNK